MPDAPRPPGAGRHLRRARGVALDRRDRGARGGHALGARLPAARGERVHDLRAPARSLGPPAGRVLGIWIGIAAGWISQVAFGLDATNLGSFDADWRHVGSASLALALAVAAFLAARVDHPPGCAAALLVALGIWDEWEHAILGGGALMLAVLGIAVHRAAGFPYPLRSGRPAVVRRGAYDLRRR